MGHIVTMLWNILVSGFTLSTLWGWFVVPLGLPEISFFHAVGIDLVASFLCPSTAVSQMIQETAEETGADPKSPFIRVVMYTAWAGFLLGVGFLTHLAMT